LLTLTHLPGLPDHNLSPWLQVNFLALQREMASTCIQFSTAASFVTASADEWINKVCSIQVLFDHQKDQSTDAMWMNLGNTMRE
jgi:hypothetical protein